MSSAAGECDKITAQMYLRKQSFGALAPMNPSYTLTEISREMETSLNAREYANILYHLDK